MLGILAKGPTIGILGKKKKKKTLNRILREYF
jgi:hypothetical protein